MERFFESVGNFFSGGDHIPWCDRDLIAVSALGTFPSVAVRILADFEVLLRYPASSVGTRVKSCTCNRKLSEVRYSRERGMGGVRWGSSPAVAVLGVQGRGDFCMRAHNCFCNVSFLMPC